METKTNKILQGYKDKSGKTQKQIALEAGVTPDSVVKFFRDPAGVGAGVAFKVSSVLGMEERVARNFWIGLRTDHKKEIDIKNWEKEVPA